MFISMSWRVWTNNMMPWWETCSPKWCSTHAVEQWRTTTDKGFWMLKVDFIS
jgi:hypothetical protein